MAQIMPTWVGEMGPEITLPGSVIGYRRDGRPIHLIAGAEDPPTDPETPPADPPKDPPAPVDPPKDPEKLGDAGKKALERERDARKAAEKAQKELEARVKEFETRDLSEKERLAAELADLKAQNDKTAREALVMRVAMAHKLEADDIDLLHGTTEEELTARAERIQALKSAATAARGPGSADQGAKTPAATDLPAQIKAAEVKGDFATAMRLKNQQAASLITNT